VKYSTPSDHRPRAATVRAVVDHRLRRRCGRPITTAFDRFYRASSALRRPGFGLGLPIVRELV
jgi:signal transduction histidine kinase